MTNIVEQIFEGVEAFRTRHPEVATEAVSSDKVAVEKVIGALHQFSEVIRYLNTRRSDGALLTMNSEAAVQDALFLMLRPWISDLVPETPTERIANRFSIKDFLSAEGRFVLEAKYIRDKEHGKSVVKEINDDIETYRYHPKCDDLIFFIYDPDAMIADTTALTRHVNAERRYADKLLRCHAIVKP